MAMSSPFIPDSKDGDAAVFTNTSVLIIPRNCPTMDASRRIPRADQILGAIFDPFTDTVRLAGSSIEDGSALILEEPIRVCIYHKIGNVKLIRSVGHLRHLHVPNPVSRDVVHVAARCHRKPGNVEEVEDV